MERATGDLDRLPRLTPIDEPAASSTECGVRRGESLAILRAMIKVLVLGVLGYFVFSILMLCWAVTFGDYPWGRWERVRDAGEYLSDRDPSFHIEDYDASVRWVGGRKGTWEIYFAHKATRQRKCLRWINGGFLYMYSFEEIDCPIVRDGPSG
jgi:hypothetical protein